MRKIPQLTNVGITLYEIQIPKNKSQEPKKKFKTGYSKLNK
jgi:hypothetical protein